MQLFSIHHLDSTPILLGAFEIRRRDLCLSNRRNRTLSSPLPCSSPSVLLVAAKSVLPGPRLHKVFVQYSKSRRQVARFWHHSAFAICSSRARSVRNLSAGCRYKIRGRLCRGAKNWALWEPPQSRTERCEDDEGSERRPREIGAAKLEAATAAAQVRVS